MDFLNDRSHWLSSGNMSQISFVIKDICSTSYIQHMLGGVNPNGMSKLPWVTGWLARSLCFLVLRCPQWSCDPDTQLQCENHKPLDVFPKSHHSNFWFEMLNMGEQGSLPCLYGAWAGLCTNIYIYITRSLLLLFQEIHILRTQCLYLCFWWGSLPF